MVDVSTAFIAFSVVILFGFFAEFIFHRFHIPDVLLLIFFGILMGRDCLGYFLPPSLKSTAPIFTTFALLFLLFEAHSTLTWSPSFGALARALR